MAHELTNAEVDAARQAVQQQLDPKTGRLRSFVSLTDRKRELEAQLKDVKARLDELEPQLTEQFQQDGVQSVNIDGYTVYLSRKLWAGAKDGDKVSLIAALKSSDESWSFLVQDNFNAQQLAARVRECDMDEQGMPVVPEQLADVMAVYEEFSIGARKSSKS